LNKGREIDDLPEMIEELSKKEQVAIVSVGPWPQVIKAGTLGTKFVPACKDGEEYSDPLYWMALPSAIPAPRRQDGSADATKTPLHEYRHNQLIAWGRICIP